LQTKEYGSHLKKWLTSLSQTHSDLCKQLRISQLLSPLQSKKVVNAAGKASRENVVTNDLLISEDTTKPHNKYVLTPVSKRLSYNEVEDVISHMKKAGEKDINHALIQGLRCHIAIYTNEVGGSRVIAAKFKCLLRKAF